MSSLFLRKESGCFPFPYNYVIIIPYLSCGVKFFFKKMFCEFLRVWVFRTLCLETFLECAKIKRLSFFKFEGRRRDEAE